VRSKFLKVQVADPRTVAPQTGSFLCKSVIPTGAQRSGGTCSCFSLRGRKFLNVRVADHSGITVHWVSFHEEEGNFKVMTGQERVMRTMKYAFIVSVLLFVLVTIQVPSKAAHPPAHSLELIVIVLALTNLALGLAGRPILSRLIKANAARDGNKAPQISGCLRTSSASH
jgi:hypothetical protein